MADAAKREGRKPVSHLIAIPGFRPALLNELVGVHRFQAHRRKKRDREMIGVYSILAGVPRATGRRRVSLEIAGPFRRLPDPDAPWKSVLDALVACAMLRDDGAAWCELGSVTYLRELEYRTVITLEDLECSS